MDSGADDIVTERSTTYKIDKYSSYNDTYLVLQGTT